MNKPLSLKAEELKNEIINKINNIELPAYCIKIILENIYKEIDNIDKKEIEDYLNNKKNEKGENDE